MRAVTTLLSMLAILWISPLSTLAHSLHWTPLLSKFVGITLGIFPSTYPLPPTPLFTNSIILSTESTSTPTIYRSGKNPYPVDKNDPKKGTKKDYSFLKCISNCKSDCELPSDGLATQRVVSMPISAFRNVILMPS